jgi:TonB family protein
VKREFPFWWAFFVAILIHTLFGVVLKRNPLLIAATPPAMSAPLQMHFVESPPNAKTAPVPPNTQHLSDADRKAGPLVKSEKREIRTTEYAKGRMGQQRKSSPSRAETPSQESVPLPQIEQPSATDSGPADIYVGPPKTDGRKLKQSLQNLDQFIGKGNEAGGSDNGDLPSGDPGSGVFFDTQGFDLGPWANRVVAIVRSNWIIPVAAELGVKGIVGVSFQVEKSGRIVNINVISTSGTPSFDQAAVNALRTSSPFPPLPADFPRPILPGVFRFYYNLPVPEQTK